MRQLHPRLLGLLAGLAILLLTVATPIALIAIGAAPWLIDLVGIDNLLRSPDDGHLAMGLLVVTAWLAWAVMSVAIGTEIVARVRGVHTPRLPALAVPQQAAGRLVTLASLLFIAVPTAMPLLATVPAHATSQVREENKSIDTGSIAMEPAPTRPDRPTRSVAAPEAIDHTVTRGETLWKIADQYLGAGARWREIFELNQAALGDRPDFLHPGTVLRVPAANAHHASNVTYVVRQGDTLSGIAESTLGKAERYPEIFEASRGTVQENGNQLTDADLILPGWRLTIPDADGSEIPDDAGRKPEVRPPHEAQVPRVGPSEEPAPTQSPSASESPVADDDASEETPDDRVTPSWLLPGLAGAGGLLAGSVWLTLRSLRRTQLRYRRPGEVIAPPPEDLWNVEKSAQSTGAPVATSLASMDRLLRHLASVADAQGDLPPDLLLAELSTETMTLHLATVCDLNAPWDGADTVWTAPLDADVEDVDQIPPYPLMVTIGQSADAHLWLANLEAFGPIGLIGDRTSAEKLARHIAAELILNPWASLVDVDLLCIGEELAQLDPVRLHVHASDDDAFLSGFAADLARAGVYGRPERFRALVSEGPSHGDAYDRVVTAYTPNAGAAVVVAMPEDESGFTSFELGSDQTLRSTSLLVDLSAAGLTTDEATTCAAIVDLTRTASPEAANLAAEHQTHEQGAAVGPEADDDNSKTRPDGPAGEASLLPLSNVIYADRAAATVEDLESLAPLVPQEPRSNADSDPDLEADLESWLDPASSLPRLTLLGPVGARTCGDAAAAVKRKPYYTEVLAYVALHPNGVTSAKLAEDFGITTNRARIDMNAVRAWLGDNPRTGRRHVPDANESGAASERGIPTYQVEDLLTDLDLFRRLRARGEKRGADGIYDLAQALKLVTGQPFDQLRPGGWSWLLEGDRLDHTMTCAVVDVAHIVATRALSEGDAPLAETAANIAHRAAPYDEIAKLDLAAALEAGGHEQEAERLLHDDVFNRRDDDLGPTELPTRTAKIVSQRGWSPPRTAR